MLIARCFRIAVAILALSTLMAEFSSCHQTSRAEERLFAGDTQGTTYSIKICAGRISTEQESAVRSAIETRLAAIDMALSTYRPDSEISRFNQFTETTPFKVSAGVIEVLQLAREVSVASDGAFDITVAPLVKAWGFGPEGRRANAPAEDRRGLVGCIPLYKIAGAAAEAGCHGDPRPARRRGRRHPGLGPARLPEGSRLRR